MFWFVFLLLSFTVIISVGTDAPAQIITMFESLKSSGLSVISIFFSRFPISKGSSFITVKDNWTEGEKFLKNANGPGNTWENNGPMVNDSIKANAGLPKEYSYLKEK